MFQYQRSTFHVLCTLIIALNLVACTTITLPQQSPKNELELRAEQTQLYIRQYIFNYCMLTTNKIDHNDKNVQQHCTDFSTYPPAIIEIMKHFNINEGKNNAPL